jgi:MFS family permease
VAVALLALGVSLRSVLWLAAAGGAVTLLLLASVREAPARVDGEDGRELADAHRLPRAFWTGLAVWTIFCLGNSSDAFLLLRAHDLGLSTTFVVLAYALYNVVYSSLSWPLGALSDRVARTWVLGAGIGVFAVVYAGLAAANGPWAVWPLLALYGTSVAATEGVARAWVADHAPGDALGTAYGAFSAATGIAVLAASLAAGLLWSAVDPSAPFWLGAALAGVAFALVAADRLRSRPGRSARRPS